jgi:hypothetical protein
MQQLLQLKQKPQEVFSTEDILDLDQLNQDSQQIPELNHLFPMLFKPSFLLELKEETKSLDIILDEEEKKLILKLKKKTKSKALAKKNGIYALKKELKMTSLTLVYNYQPDYAVKELQPVVPMEPITNAVKPLEITQPKTVLSNAPKLPIKKPILIDNPENITIILPLPEYTENSLKQLSDVSYEDMFKPFSKTDYSEMETVSNTDNYQLVPEKLLRPEDSLQQYKTNLTVQTQNLEGQLAGPQVIKYNRPKFEDGEFVYQKIRMRATTTTTVYDLIRNSGLPIKAGYSRKFNGVYVQSLNGVPESNTYWEYKINGQYGTTTVDKAIVKPGDSVTWVLKTAGKGVCGRNN